LQSQGVIKGKEKIEPLGKPPRSAISLNNKLEPGKSPRRVFPPTGRKKDRRGRRRLPSSLSIKNHTLVAVLKEKATHPF